MAAIPPTMLVRTSPADSASNAQLSPPLALPAMTTDHIATSGQMVADLSSAVGTLGAGAWSTANGAAAQAGPTLSNAAGTISSNVLRALTSSAAGGAAISSSGALAVGAMGADLAATIARQQYANAAAAEPPPSWTDRGFTQPQWRQHVQNAAEDGTDPYALQTYPRRQARADTTMTGHPASSSTTVYPSVPPSSVQHTGHTSPAGDTIAIKPLTNPIHTPGTSTTVTPVGNAPGLRLSTPIHSISAKDLMLASSRFKLTSSAGPPTQGVVDLNSPASVHDAQRIEELRGQMTSDTAGRASVAVAVAKDASGNEVHLISSNQGKYLQPNMKPNDDETRVGKRGVDAEQNIVNYAREKSLTLVDIAASRPICSNCENAIEPTGAHMSSPLKGSPARGDL